MAEEQEIAPVEEEPMPEVNENSDEEAVNELDELFRDRFTENDSDFMAVMNKEAASPPVIASFLDLKYQR